MSRITDALPNANKEEMYSILGANIVNYWNYLNRHPRLSSKEVAVMEFIELQLHEIDPEEEIIQWR